MKEHLDYITFVPLQVAISRRVERYYYICWALGAQREADQNSTTYVSLDDSGANRDSCATRPPDWCWALEVF